MALAVDNKTVFIYFVLWYMLKVNVAVVAKSLETPLKYIFLGPIHEHLL